MFSAVQSPLPQLLGTLVGLILVGCGSSSDSRPDDVSGTKETLEQLILGGSGVPKEMIYVKLCVTPDGLCVRAAYRVDECFRYDDLEAFVDGVAIPQTWPGGWSNKKRFKPLPNGGNGHGCAYPSFETDDLQVSKGRTTKVEFRINGEVISATVNDWLLKRTLNVPALLIRGEEVFIDVEPPIEPDVQFQEHGADMWTDIVYEYEEAGPDDPFSFSFGKIARESRQGGGFFLQVPIDSPIGAGSFRFNEGGVRVNVANCPFAACEVTVNRRAEVMGISIIE